MNKFGVKQVRGWAGLGKRGENEPGKTCNGIAVALNFSISFNLESTKLMPPQNTQENLKVFECCGLLGHGTASGWGRGAASKF